MVGRETQVVIPLTPNHQPALSNISETSNIVVRAKCDLTRSVQLITGMLDTPNVTSSTMLIEPVTSLSDSLCVAYSLSFAHHNEVVMQVISPSPITIYQGMAMGKAVPEDTVLFVSDSIVKSKPDICFDDLQLPDLSEAERTKLVDLLTEFLFLLKVPVQLNHQRKIKVHVRKTYRGTLYFSQTTMCVSLLYCVH